MSESQPKNEAEPQLRTPMGGDKGLFEVAALGFITSVEQILDGFGELKEGLYPTMQRLNELSKSIPGESHISSITGGYAIGLLGSIAYEYTLGGGNEANRDPSITTWMTKVGVLSSISLIINLGIEYSQLGKDSLSPGVYDVEDVIAGTLAAAIAALVFHAREVNANQA